MTSGTNGRSIKIPNLSASAISIFSGLSDHAFVMSILKDSTPLMKAKHEGITEYTEQQKYNYITGHYVGEVLNQLERIEQAGTLLNSYPYVKAWRKQYGQFQYFQYHMEAYYLGVVGLVDRILLLTKQLCRLEVSDRDANITLIIKRLKEQRYSELVTALEILKDGTKAVKKVRNDVAHAERFHEKDLWHIALLEFSLRERTVEDPDGFLKADLDFFTKIYRKKKSDQLQSTNNDLIPMVSKLFDELNIIYAKERTRSENAR